MRDRRITGGRGASANAEPASARGNSASHRVNRHLEAAGDYRRPRGSSFERQGTLEHLAEQIGALLATTAQAKGLFAGNPFYVGSSGGFAWELGERLLSQADLILAFGASLN